MHGRGEVLLLVETEDGELEDRPDDAATTLAASVAATMSSDHVAARRSGASGSTNLCL